VCSIGRWSTVGAAVSGVNDAIRNTPTVEVGVDPSSEDIVETIGMGTHSIPTPSRDAGTETNPSASTREAGVDAMPLLRSGDDH
jgi:hypothetical protein